MQIKQRKLKALFQLYHCDQDQRELRSAFDEQNELVEQEKRLYNEQLEIQKAKNQEKARNEKDAATIEKKKNQVQVKLKKHDQDHIATREQLERERKRVQNADDRISSLISQDDERNRKVEQLQNDLNELDKGLNGIQCFLSAFIILKRVVTYLCIKWL